jgi:hypothetical protein
MARGQGAAGRCGAAGALSPRRPIAVVVRDRREAEAALALEQVGDVEVILLSAPGAASYAGVGYLHALGELVGREILVDCGVDAGLVLAGLRTGLKRLLFRGEVVVLAKLREIAQQLDAEIRTPTELPAEVRPHPWGGP